MKIKLLIISFTLIAFISKAQSYFGNDACWTEYWINPNTKMLQGKRQYYLDGDTILNNISYKKVMARSPSNLQQPTHYMGAIREEAGKVFNQYTDDNTPDMKEFLLYDFNLNVGDTIFSTSPSGTLSRKPVVVKIDTIELLIGEKRKHFYFDGTAEWIEGIGSISGFFVPAEELPTGYSIPELACYKQNEIEYYKNNDLCPDGTCCDLVTSLKTPNFNNQIISISPNPTNRFIRLDFSRSIYPCKSIKLMDALGSVLQKSTQILNSNFEVDLINYSSGLYIVIIEFEKNCKIYKIIKL